MDKEIRQWAYKIVNRAIREGFLIKPTKCEECGRENIAIEGHHNDYTRPLDLEWLCERCHSKRNDNPFGLMTDWRMRPVAYLKDFFKRLYLEESYLLAPKREARYSRTETEKKNSNTITGTIYSDKQLWEARIRYCGKACVKINKLTEIAANNGNDNIVYRVTKPSHMRNPEQERLEYLEWLEENKSIYPPSTYRKLLELHQ